MPVFQPDSPNIRRPTEQQLQDLIDEARNALDILENGHHPDAENAARLMAASELIAAIRQRRRVTGLPTSTRREGGPSTVLDDENVPMPPLADPVGETVASALSDVGAADVHAATMLRELRTGVSCLRASLGALAKATPSRDEEPKGDPGCKVHATYGVWEPVYRSERCRWDYEFWLSNGVDVPEPIMRARLDGRRITMAMVARALAPPDHNKKRRKVRARAPTRD